MQTKKPERKRTITYSCRVTPEELAYLESANARLGACNIRDGILMAYDAALSALSNKENRST